MFKWISNIALVLCIIGCSNGAVDAVDAEVATPLITQDELIELLSSAVPPLVMDVRTPEEYQSGHVPSALNIPHTELSGRLSEIEFAKEQPLVVYCKSGRRAGMAELVLREAGFGQLLHLEGDMSAWQAAGLPMEKQSAEDTDEGV